MLMTIALIMLLIAGCAAYVLLNWLMGIPVVRSLICVIIYLVFAIIIQFIKEPNDWLYFLLGYTICIISIVGYKEDKKDENKD